MSGVDTQPTGSVGTQTLRPPIGVDANLRSSANMYGAQQDGEYTLAAVPYEQMEGRFRRQRVINRTGMEKGTILVDPHSHHAYYVLSHDEAVRYGIGVGKAGFEWTGDAVIGRKAQWPRWTPPSEMIDRSPELEKYRNGMPGGIENPLGRPGALSLCQWPRYAVSAAWHAAMGIDWQIDVLRMHQISQSGRY